MLFYGFQCLQVYIVLIFSLSIVGNNVAILMLAGATLDRFLSTFRIVFVSFDSIGYIVPIMITLSWVIGAGMFWGVFGTSYYILKNQLIGYCSSNRVYTNQYTLYGFLSTEIITCFLALVIHRRNLNLLNKFNVDCQQHNLNERFQLNLFK